MKNEFMMYGKRTGQIAKRLSEKDRQILDDFQRYCAMTAGVKRLARCRICLLQFRDTVEKPFDQITKEDAIAFWALLNSAPHEEHTKITIRKVVKRFLKWYYRDLEMIEPLKVPSTHVVNKHRVNKSTLLQPEELQRMLHAAERLRDKALLVLVYETAARPQEIRDLQWRHINWDAREVHLYSRKTKEDRDLPLQESLKHLRRWHDEWIYSDPRPSDYVFPAVKHGRYDRTTPIRASYINWVIKRLAKKAGIDRNVYSYLLRHTRLTEIRKAGVQGIEFRKFAGHAPSSVQEQVYVHLDNEDMKQSVLEKVYKIQGEQVPAKRYENRVDVLEEQLNIVTAHVREMREALSVVVAQIGSSNSAMDDVGGERCTR